MSPSLKIFFLTEPGLHGTEKLSAPASLKYPLSHFKFILWGVLALMMVTNVSYAQDLSALGLPALTTETGENGETTYSLSLQILLLMTALTVLPSLVLGMTAFTRIIIVLSILRQALGTQQTPPNQVLIHLLRYKRS